MNDEATIRTALTVWQQMEPSPGVVSGRHLSEPELYRLAQPGALEQADPELLEHLSLCPVCQEQWFSWQESCTILGGDVDSPDNAQLAVGFLKAASASLFREPLSLVSSCGRFELCVYPERQQQRRAMITLEVLIAPEALEGSYCRIRDGRGVVVLEGRIDLGRLAGRIEDPGQLDLTTWTVIVAGDDEC